MSPTDHEEPKGEFSPPCAGGWVRDDHDPRDLSHDHPSVREVASALGITLSGGTLEKLPAKKDISDEAPPTRNEETVDGCVAIAVGGVVEMLERRIGNDFVPSRRFIHKVARNILQWGADRSGSRIRAAVGAVAMVGVPPERYWDWDSEAMDDEPSPFCYALARDYRVSRYARLDQPHAADKEVIEAARAVLNAGIPIVAGFTLYQDPVNQSIGTATAGDIPIPGEDDEALGGHAVLVVGYDDDRVIVNERTRIATKGAIRFQNCWSEKWGESGFGWLPYDYVTIGQSADWWLLLDPRWVALDRFAK